MNVLEKILEEIDNRKSYHEKKLYQRDDYEIQKMYCDEELDWITNIIRSHKDDASNDEKCSGNNHAFVVKDMTAEQFKELTKNQNSFKKAMERFNRNKGCMVYEVNSNTTEDVKPVSREYINECAEVARKYKRNTEDWIPIEERLPNQNGVYNVTRLIDGTFKPDSAYFDGQDTWHNDNRVNHARPYLTDIVAWQSLPTRYTPPVISKQAQDLRDREKFFTE